MAGSKLAIILLGACCAFVCACRSQSEQDTSTCARYARFEGPPVDATWCREWLRDWHTHTYRSSERCLSQADSRLEMRLCEFQDEEGATAYPFARRECALAATTMEEFDACAKTAPTEPEKTFVPIGPELGTVLPATLLGLVHREQGWHALLLEPSYAVRDYDDKALLALVSVSAEGFGRAVWRIEPEGFDPYAEQKFLVGHEFLGYVTKDGELRTVRLVAEAQSEVALTIGPKRQMVGHSLLPGPTGPRGVVITQPQGEPRPITGPGRADEKREPVTPWLPQFRLEPLGGEARMLVEYTEDEVSGTNVKFAPSAINYGGAPLAVAWTGPHRDNKERPFHVALFDDDGNETFRTEVEGFEAMWLASTSDGIATILAKPKFRSARDMTVFRFSVEGEVGERRRFNWRESSYAIPIACGNRLALVRVSLPGLNEGDHGFADYWDLSGRENLDLPERIWWGKKLGSIELTAGCEGEQPVVAWLAGRTSQTSPGMLDSRGIYDSMLMPIP